MSDANSNFEKNLSELEARVRRLEGDELSLDDALALYEEGVQLAEACHEQLAAAEQRVAKLSHTADGLEETPLEDVSG